MKSAFMPAAERAKIPLQTEMEGGGDPTTEYMVNYLSRKFGPVYVFRAKLPTFPNTFEGTKTMPEGQVAYWSVVTVASAPSGELWDGVFDMQVLLAGDLAALAFGVAAIAQDGDGNRAAQVGGSAPRFDQ